MKVYIGPYRDCWMRCNIYSNYMDKKYGYDWPGEQTKFEKRLEKLEDIIQLVYNVTINKIYSLRKRKIKVRIDRYDTWSADSTLSLIILPLLKQLKERKQGSPCVDSKDLPKHLRTTKKQDTDELIHQRWDWIIDEMIWTFETLNSEDQEYVFEEDGRLNGEKTEENQKRIDNGLRLFGKYFRCLWS